jgi:hypothetical protein
MAVLLHESDQVAGTFARSADPESARNDPRSMKFFDAPRNSGFAGFQGGNDQVLGIVPELQFNDLGLDGSRHRRLSRD